MSHHGVPYDCTVYNNAPLFTFVSLVHYLHVGGVGGVSSAAPGGVPRAWWFPRPLLGGPVVVEMSSAHVFMGLPVPQYMQRRGGRNRR